MPSPMKTIWKGKSQSVLQYLNESRCAYHWDRAIVTFKLGTLLVFVNRQSLVVTQGSLVSPDWLPGMTLSIDLCLVGDDVDTATLLLAKEVIENSS